MLLQLRTPGGPELLILLFNLIVLVGVLVVAFLIAQFIWERL